MTSTALSEYWQYFSIVENPFTTGDNVKGYLPGYLREILRKF